MLGSRRKKFSDFLADLTCVLPGTTRGRSQSAFTIKTACNYLATPLPSSSPFTTDCCGRPALLSTISLEIGLDARAMNSLDRWHGEQTLLVQSSWFSGHKNSFVPKVEPLQGMNFLSQQLAMDQILSLFLCHQLVE